MKNLDEVIAAIRSERLDKGIKQAEIAQRMGCSVTFVQAIEYRHNVDRRWGTVLAYAEAVGVNINVTVGEQ